MVNGDGLPPGSFTNFALGNFSSNWVGLWIKIGKCCGQIHIVEPLNCIWSNGISSELRWQCKHWAI